MTDIDSMTHWAAVAAVGLVLVAVTLGLVLSPHLRRGVSGHDKIPVGGQGLPC